MKCEEFLLAKMAEADGEEPGIPVEILDQHLASCESCQVELANMRSLDEVFGRHTRAEVDANVWPAVQRKIAVPARNVGWHLFAVLALALAAFKIVELSVDKDPGWLFGLAPLALAVVLFLVLRENPFKVNTELTLESHHG